MKHTLPVSAGIAMCAILAVSTRNLAQEGPETATPNHGVKPRYGAKPWSGGTLDDAMTASKSGSTIPLSTYSFSPTKVKEKETADGNHRGDQSLRDPADWRYH